MRAGSVLSGGWACKGAGVFIEFQLVLSNSAFFTMVAKVIFAIFDK